MPKSSLVAGDLTVNSANESFCSQRAYSLILGCTSQSSPDDHYTPLYILKELAFLIIGLVSLKSEGQVYWLETLSRG